MIDEKMWKFKVRKLRTNSILKAIMKITGDNSKLHHLRNFKKKIRYISYDKDKKSYSIGISYMRTKNYNSMIKAGSLYTTFHNYKEKKHD